MKDLATKAVVTGPNGFYYREEHEWHNIDDSAGREFSQFMKDVAHDLNRRGPRGVGDLTATLSAVVDGAPQPDFVVQGVSYDELADFEKRAHQFAGRLVGFSDDNAKRKRGQGGGKGRPGTGNQSGNESGN